MQRTRRARSCSPVAVFRLFELIERVVREGAGVGSYGSRSRTRSASTRTTTFCRTVHQRIQKFSPDGKLLMVRSGRIRSAVGDAPMAGVFGWESSVHLPPPDRRRVIRRATSSLGRLRRLASWSPTRTAASSRPPARVETARSTSTPHAIAVDQKGMVYVADRGNSRIVVLGNDLNQKAVRHGRRAVGHLHFVGAHPYLYTSTFLTGNN